MLGLFKVIPTGFIPDEDQGMLISVVTLPDGASLNRTQDVCLKFIKAILVCLIKRVSKSIIKETINNFFVL